MKKLLLVEDNADLRELVKPSLEQKGYTVVTAANGREGLELAGTIRPHVIVSDINMPDMTGVQMCQEIKKDDSFNETIFILTSAYSHREEVEENIKDSGCDFFLRKPYEIDALVELIEKIS